MDKHYMAHCDLMSLIMNKLIDHNFWVNWETTQRGEFYEIRYSKNLRIGNLTFAQICQLVGLM